MPSTCVVSNCEDKDSSRHRLPNPARFLKQFNDWLEAIGRNDIKEMDPLRVYNNYRICHRHFAKEYFSTNMYLKPDSIPTLFLPKRRPIPESPDNIDIKIMLDESHHFQHFHRRKKKTRFENIYLKLENSTSEVEVGIEVKPEAIIIRPTVLPYYFPNYLEQNIIESYDEDQDTVQLFLTSPLPVYVFRFPILEEKNQFIDSIRILSEEDD